MLLASKCCDSVPLNVAVVADQIGYGEFSPADLKGREREVLRVLSFDLNFATLYDFLEADIAVFLNGHSEPIGESQWQAIRRMRELSLYLGIMSRYEYQMLNYTYAA